MDSMKLGVLSDTHGLLRQEVLDCLRGVGAILHGGDINNAGILLTLRDVAPVYAVRGNNDREWAEAIPPFLDFEIAGLRVYMTHRKRDLPGDLSAWDLVVCGHSHRYEESRIGKTVLLNPGSCGPRRFNQAITLAIVTVKGGAIDVERVEIPHQGPPRPRIQADLRGQIETVMKEMQRGRPAVEIAARRGWDAGLVEQIARLYATHPGVTADGILDKMGV